jgi:hypothetical protein
VNKKPVFNMFRGFSLLIRHILFLRYPDTYLTVSRMFPFSALRAFGGPQSDFYTREAAAAIFSFP